MNCYILINLSPVLALVVYDDTGNIIISARHVKSLLLPDMDLEYLNDDDKEHYEISN